MRAVVLVKGIHFYGFHSHYAPFLKIHIADPAFVNRAVTIMQSGTVMKTRFRVYESHLSYLLQFLSDFGLYGCGWVDLGEVWQRGADELPPGCVDPEVQATFKESPYFRQTRMPLEIDVAAHQIMSRHKLVARNIHHKLTIPAPPLPQEPLVISVRELWEDERQRREAKGLTPSPELPKDPSANSRGPGGDWVSEARWWEEIRTRIERERGKEMVPPRMAWEKWVMTTFESIEALWEDEYKTWRPRSSTDGVNVGNPVGSFVAQGNPYEASQTASTRTELNGPDRAFGDEFEVDEALLNSQVMSQLMEAEDVDWNKDVNGQDEAEDDEQREYPEEDEELAENGPPPELPSKINSNRDRYG